jgi:hypothetical protein
MEEKLVQKEKKKGTQAEKIKKNRESHFFPLKKKKVSVCFGSAYGILM